MTTPIQIEFLDFPKISRYTDPITKKRYYNTPNGALPSVTTILSKTADKTGINNWRARVGAAQADKIMTYSINVGTLMHANIEHWLVGDPMLPGSNDIRVKARQMAQSLIDELLIGRLTSIHGIEADLYHTDLYAGATDMIGIYDGELSIIDFKNSRKEKKEEYVADYKLQLAAYALAFESMFGIAVDQGVILVSTQDDKRQIFKLDKDAMDIAKDDWADRLCQYYSM